MAPSSGRSWHASGVTEEGSRSDDFAVVPLPHPLRRELPPKERSLGLRI